MTNKIKTLYKGDLKRRVGTEQERRQLLAAGWSEKAPRQVNAGDVVARGPAPVLNNTGKSEYTTKPAEAKPAPKTDSK